MQKRADLKATAYHEAGHAVIAWLCDHTLGEITIRPNHERGFDGNVQHNDAGCNDLFGFRELALDPDAPGGWAVRTGEATTRHLTEHERHWLHLHERLGLEGREFGPASFWEPEVMIAAAGFALLTRGERHGLGLNAFSRVPIDAPPWMSSASS